MGYSIESIAQLEHSKGFARLHQKFHQFNPLKVLRVDQFEIRHSNVLAWLLDPNENHQLGGFFVKKLLSRLVIKADNEDKLEGFDFLTYLHTSFSDAEVYREVKTKTNRFIDLLVVIPSQKLVLVIENKFHAGESIGQLEDYLSYAQDNYKGNTIIPVFLTLSSDAPSYQYYFTLDYNDILEIITSHLELHKDAISDNIYEFLAYYSAILREQLVKDDEAIELALEVYQANQAAVDLLYLSQNYELRKLARYKESFEQVDGLSEYDRTSLSRIYHNRKQTVDYIFHIGSSVLREAFLAFVQLEEIPEDLYKAQVSTPNFILPEWMDFTEVFGEPERGYWLGHGLIIWFERTWDERMKVNVEVGPVPSENRLKLLNALEHQGVSFRLDAKLEGKKYTKIYTGTTEVADWANKHEVVAGMERLYQHPEITTTFKKIALAVESMEEVIEESEEIERVVYEADSRRDKFPPGAFKKFAEVLGINEDMYQMKNYAASFLIPIFRELEKTYGVTREKWWWHDSTFTYWFDRLRDDRLKLTIELGPLQPEQRLEVIEQLEALGLPFTDRSKLPNAKYTRLFSESKVIGDWNNEDELVEQMCGLYFDRRNQEILEMINALRH